MLELVYRSVLEDSESLYEFEWAAFVYVMVISIRAELLKFCQSKHSRSSICFHKISSHEIPTLVNWSAMNIASKNH